MCTLTWRFTCLLLLLLIALDGARALPTTSRLMVPVAIDERAGAARAKSWKRSAPFEMVRTRLSEDFSGVEGDDMEKYFHESTFHPHYDGRFADDTLPEHLRHVALTHLVQTYLSTMASLGAETWLMHGSLLGWWWNREIMPWDSDIDVQINMDSTRYLAAFHNMTVHHFRLPPTDEPREGAEEGQELEWGSRDYLLEINPHYRNDSTADKLNVIDARWIDTDTGLFIDITTLRPNWTARAEGIDGAMMCKDRHHYLEQDIFPLRTSTFEGAPVKIPFAYSELLQEEYGPTALTQTVFQGHVFEEGRGEWRGM
ncbi:hypothetical protein NA57DRAFT_47802 [Rhizodiscina lignyota]|uniref:LicD/FKTN/FKRP nucleotidyltransferase domain-containing protein n=1 Tax=Rhizodiscina lignyota TaxID=1504668 RepID=A0A9P4I283_9PEZI|nr:hypothetical protein NA57DRAFT_47802 [Rhizodiscina lignyota]